MLPDCSFDVYERAAKHILTGEHSVYLLTGFPVEGQPETDAPPGAIALAEVLQKLGKRTTIVSWLNATKIFNSACDRINFKNLHDLNVRNTDATVIAIEVCGKDQKGRYLNYKHEDIGPTAPKFEDVFGLICDIAIGDGGNEFGMGNAPTSFFSKWKVSRPVSTSTHLLPATVSNFGCYGLLRELEKLTCINLLPNISLHLNQIRNLGCEPKSLN
jgi:hypothetical protein